MVAKKKRKAFLSKVKIALRTCLRLSSLETLGGGSCKCVLSHILDIAFDLMMS